MKRRALASDRAALAIEISSPLAVDIKELRVPRKTLYARLPSGHVTSVSKSPSN
jgi:hypothetical protein